MYTQNAWEKSLPNHRLQATLLGGWGGESTKIKQPLFVLSGQGESQGNQYLGFLLFHLWRNIWERVAREDFLAGLLQLSISRRTRGPWMSTPNRLLRPATRPQKVTFSLRGLCVPPDGGRNGEQHGDWKVRQQRHSNCSGCVHWRHPGARYDPLSR